MPIGTPFPWPDHWISDGTELVRCIVPNCSFITSAIAKTVQWKEIDDHCLDTRGSEHDLLRCMLRQKLCAYSGCPHYSNISGDTGYKLRRLFYHEITVHGSATMSEICSFVRLAREGRIVWDLFGGLTQLGPRWGKPVLERMLDKVMAQPWWTELLFQKNPFNRPDEHTREKLGAILTFDLSTEPGDDPPYWRPTPAEFFLGQCCPDPLDREDDLWAIVWNELRTLYAQGEI